MCLYLISKKINIYNRDPEQFTRIDCIATYSFIISLILIIFFYSKKYYEIIILDIRLCEKKDSEYNCLKSEFINIVVPYIGILCGFIQTLFLVHNKISILINYVLCCVYCCNKNPNIVKNLNNNIELNRF